LEKIEFTLFGLTLLEPMALVLNWVMMIQCLFYFRKLNLNSDSRFGYYWNLFFIFFAVSVFLGGISHVAYNYLGQTGKLPGWTAGLAAVYFLELAMIQGVEEKNKKLLKFLIGIKAVIFVALTFYTQTFTYVMIHTGFILVFVSIPAIRDFQSGRRRFDYTFYGVLALLCALPVKVGKIDLHLWFNRDDLSHVFMILALWFFYKGVEYYEEKAKTIMVPTSAAR
jgi:hypothetical protein